jgi:hypothetical protein
MQCLEVSGAVRPIYGSLGVKRLKVKYDNPKGHINQVKLIRYIDKIPFNNNNNNNNNVPTWDQENTVRSH